MSPFPWASADGRDAAPSAGGFKGCDFTETQVHTDFILMVDAVFNS